MGFLSFTYATFSLLSRIQNVMGRTENLAIGEGRLMRTRASARLETFYRQYAPDAVRLAYLLTQDYQTAQDIAHEAFVRIGGRLVGLRDSDHQRGYLLRTVINLSRGHGRRLQRERRALRRLGAPAEFEERPGVESDALWNAIARLPLRQRTVIYLRYYRGLSESETAEALEVSTGAVKGLALRAKKALRGQLEEASE
jgi:RNA polymerase sigma factor (sigma-70 family)